MSRLIQINQANQSGLIVDISAVNMSEGQSCQQANQSNGEALICFD
jgi:hypothetical protein